MKTTSDEAEAAKPTSAKAQLGPESTNPPRLIVLPDDLTPDARITSLKNPRYLSDDQYVVCPEKGIYEFKIVSAPKTNPRSWLLAHPPGALSTEPGDGTSDSNISGGYVTRTADLFIITPIDPLFFLLPTLSPAPKSSDAPKRLFLSSDDYFERLSDASPNLGCFLRKDSLRKLLESRMRVVCETVEAGDETMYRLDEESLLKELLQKAKRMAQRGLPASMEEKLVRKALEAPVLSIMRDKSSLQDSESNETEATTLDVSTPLSGSTDTQTTVSSIDGAASSFSQASTAATSFSEDSATPTLAPESKSLPPKITAPEGVAELLRLRVAFDFLSSNYITPHISENLKRSLATPTSLWTSAL